MLRESFDQRKITINNNKICVDQERNSLRSRKKPSVIIIIIIIKGNLIKRLGNLKKRLKSVMFVNLPINALCIFSNNCESFLDRLMIDAKAKNKVVLEITDHFISVL